MEDALKEIAKNPTMALIALTVLAAIGRFAFNRLVKQFELIASELKELIGSISELSTQMQLSNERQDRAFEGITENKAEIKQMRERIHYLGGELAGQVQIHEERLSNIMETVKRIDKTGCVHARNAKSKD